MGFLNGENYKKLQYVFYPRTTYTRTTSKTTGKTNLYKKNIIPVGVHELQVARVDERRSKNNWEMLELYIHKEKDCIYEYDTDYDRNMIRFDDIVCRHAISKRPMGRLAQEWFKPYTACLGKQEFDKMKTWRGKRFKAVVINKQCNVDYSGVVKRDAIGEPILWWDAQIVAVYPVDVKVTISDWFSLFRPIKYDPVGDAMHPRMIDIYRHNVKELTGGDVQLDVPF